jgi:predicted metal-dependent hydrolase
MRPGTQHHISLAGRRVAYRLVRSRAARKLRVRVGPAGVEVVQPKARPDEDVPRFLHTNEDWILGQMDRAAQLRLIRRPAPGAPATILFRGTVAPVSFLPDQGRSGPNQVTFQDGSIVIRRGASSHTPPQQSLENWLRKQARQAIRSHLAKVLPRVRRTPGKLYVMAQRTKWGNCSRLGNLSFNWRLIMAPDFVLRYIVAHEAVHLAIPDHSSRFWLTLQSLCPETDRARQWLAANARQLYRPISAPPPAS